MMQTSTTPVPNIIFDVYLKDLKSAELKVLLIIIRQTLGWADRRGIFGRKETDWISGNQLKQKTGSSKRAITSAINTLIQKRLIEVQDEMGYNLTNPGMRQGKTKLYYKLAKAVYHTVENTMENIETNAKIAKNISKNVTTLVQKMHITKETLQN